MNLVYLWATLAVALPWFGVTIWQFVLSRTSITLIGKNPTLANFFLIVTILWLAIVESIAIYWLVVAMSILSKWEWLQAIKAISSALAIGIPWFGVWLFEWFFVSASLESINRNPANKWTVLAFMVLFMALIEVVSIYGLIIALKIL